MIDLRLLAVRRRFRAAIAALAIVLCAGAARADVVCVPNDAIDGSCTLGLGAATISAGVTLAAPGDTVLVDDGSYVELVTINKDITLLSRNGRAATSISPPASPGSALGTVRVTSPTTAVQIGGTGQGFTINGIDNTSPGLESAALYFQGGPHSNAQILDNEIVAAGDSGLITEFSATISGFVISGNEFSGSTFTGAPAGNGFGSQFTLANVPRQLVVMGGGAGGSPTSNITFTNNVVSGTAGGINPDLTGTECPVVGQTCEQGNNLVTIDSNGATITGNTFSGTTSRFGVSYRGRGPSTTVSGNDFDSSGLTPTCGHVFLQNTGSNLATVAGANTFDKGVYVDGAIGTLGISIAAAVAAAPSGSTIDVLAGTYDEPRLTETNGSPLPMQIAVTAKDISIAGAGQAQTIIRPTGDTGSSGNSRGWFLVDTGSTLDLSGLTLDGSGRLVYQAIRNQGNGGTIGDVRFTEIKYNPSGPHYQGTAIAAFGTGPVHVSDSVFDEIGRVGVLYFGSGVNGSSFSGNTYTGKGTGDFLDYMLDISAGAAVTASGNHVSGNRGVASSDSSQSAGILVSTFFGAGTTAGIDGNVIEDNTYGVVVGFSTAGCPGPSSTCDTSAATMSCNLFQGNDVGVVAEVEDGATVSIDQSSFVGNGEGVDATQVFGGTVDATGNWWSALDGPGGAGPGSGDSVSANVDFSSFLSAPPPCVSCSQDTDCDDLLECNGSETCDTGTGTCQSGTPVDCSSASDSCNVGACVEPDTCVSNPLPDGTGCVPSIICGSLGTCDAGVCEVDDTDGDGICDANQRPALSLRRARVKESTKVDRDLWNFLGEIDTTSAPMDFIDVVAANGIEVVLFHNGGGVKTEVSRLAFTAGDCVELRRRIRCRHTASRSVVGLWKRSAPNFFRVRGRINRQNLDVPLLADTPLTISIRTTENATLVGRNDDIGPAGCTQTGSRLVCRDLP